MRCRRPSLRATRPEGRLHRQHDAGGGSPVRRKGAHATGLAGRASVRAGDRPAEEAEEEKAQLLSEVKKFNP